MELEGFRKPQIEADHCGSDMGGLMFVILYRRSRWVLLAKLLNISAISLDNSYRSTFDLCSFQDKIARQRYYAQPKYTAIDWTRNTLFLATTLSPVFSSKADNTSPTLKDRVRIYLGSEDLSASPGSEYRAVAVHIHPKRIEKELEHRKKQEGKGEYLPYAGLYDITVVKLNKYVPFEKDKARSST